VRRVPGSGLREKRMRVVTTNAQCSRVTRTRRKQLLIEEMENRENVTSIMREVNRR